jgi:hypothetical protein
VPENPATFNTINPGVLEYNTQQLSDLVRGLQQQIEELQQQINTSKGQLSTLQGYVQKQEGAFKLDEGGNLHIVNDIIFD